MHIPNYMKLYPQNGIYNSVLIWEFWLTEMLHCVTSDKTWVVNYATVRTSNIAPLWLMKEAVSSSGNTASMVGWLNSNELEKMWNGVVVE